MARYFKMEVFVNDEKAATVATFDAKDVKRPLSGKELGWYFDVEKEQQSLSSCCLKKLDAKRSFIPYRKLTGVFKATQNEGQPTYLTTTYLLGRKQVTSLKFVFEYDRDWDYITKEELAMLLGWLNDLRVARHALLKDLKRKCLNNGNYFIGNKTSLEASQKGEGEIKKQIQASQDLAKTLAQKNETLVQDLTKTLKEILDTEKLLPIKNKERNDANAIAAQLGSQLKAMYENIDTLTKQKLSGKMDAASFQSSMDSAKDQFEAILKDLKEEYSIKNDYDPLENARKAIFEGDAPDLTKCNAALFEAYPNS